MAADTPPPSIGPGTPTNRAGPRWGRIRGWWLLQVGGDG
jgi:hypothetical protein